jgi:hypothetical protein
MKFLCLVLLILISTSGFDLLAQDKKVRKSAKQPRTEATEIRTGIARIQIFASPAKGTGIAEIARMPLFFGPKSDLITYKKTGFSNNTPPTVGDSIKDLTSDSLAVFFKKDLYTMSGYGDVGTIPKGKKNMIHDLPTENPQKIAVDSVFDESIDIGCYWTFIHNDEQTGYIPTVMIKMEVYDKTGQARPERSVTLLPSEVKTSHFKSNYGVDYNFIKGIKREDLEDGGIVGNVIADVYLQALNKLLAKK